MTPENSRRGSARGHPKAQSNGVGSKTAIAGNDRTNRNDGIIDREGTTWREGTIGGEGSIGRDGASSPGTTWKPTRVSRRLAVLVSGSVIGLLGWQLPETRVPIVVGAIGALCLAVGLWLVGDDQLPNLLASLLTVPIGVGLTGGVLVVTVVLLGGIFPVAEPALLSFGTLVVASYVGVVVGSTLAVLGLLLGSRNVVDAEALRRYSNLTFVTGIVPGAIGLTLATSALLVGDGGPIEFVLDLWSGGMSALLTADGGGTHVGTFLMAVFLAALGVKFALSTLPVGEFLDDGSGGDYTDRLGAIQQTLTVGIVVAGAVGAVALFLELVLPSGAIELLPGGSLVDTIEVVTTSSTLRTVLVVLAISTFFAAIAGNSLRQYAQVTSSQRNRRVIALVAGGAISLVAIVLAPQLYWMIVDAVFQRLPEIIAPNFQEGSTRIATTYGEATAIVLLSAVMIGATGFVLSGLRIGLHFGYLSGESTGYSLASAGLFIGVLFAGTLGTPPWLIFLGIVGSIVVWDVGRFGTTLGREIGDGNATNSVEIVHVFGTVLVGLVGFLIALGTIRFLHRGVSVDTSTGMLALLLIVFGILALVEALR